MSTITEWRNYDVILCGLRAYAIHYRYDSVLAFAYNWVYQEYSRPKYVA